VNKPDLSIIIVNYNFPLLIARCIASIDAFLGDLSKEVIVVDNNSREESLHDLQRQYDYLKVIKLTENMGFGQANNIGVKQAASDCVLLLNSDTELIDGSLKDALYKFQQSSAKTLWGLKILWPDHRFQNSFSHKIHFLDFVFTYTLPPLFAHVSRRVRAHKHDGLPLENVQEVDIVYGTAMLLFRNDFLKIGGFSSRYFMYFEDIDLCDRFREKLGGHIYYYPFSVLIHHVQGSARNRSKGAINWMYLKSKYAYGRQKFGVIGILVILLLDLPLMTLRYLYFRLFAGDCAS
jgi:GT2 family glycosyltransferase